MSDSPNQAPPTWIQWKARHASKRLLVRVPLAIEWALDCFSYRLRTLALFDLLELAGRCTVLVIAIFWLLEADDRAKERHYRAWELINSARGSSGDGGAEGRAAGPEQGRCQLAAAPLEQAHLPGVSLAGAELSGANLKSADLTWANLEGARLAGANLENAELWRANLKGANLWERKNNIDGGAVVIIVRSGANLKGAQLWGANLEGAVLEGANLENAYFGRANLKGAYLGEANLKGAKNLTQEAAERGRRRREDQAPRRSHSALALEHHAGEGAATNQPEMIRPNRRRLPKTVYSALPRGIKNEGL